MKWEDIILDKEDQYIAEISVWKTGAALSFKTDDTAIQNYWVDEDVFNYLNAQYPEITGDTGYFEMPAGIRILSCLQMMPALLLIGVSKDTNENKCGSRL